MSWGYVAVAAATVIGGAMSSNSQKKSAKKAAAAQQAAAADSVGETRRQFDITTANQQPFIDAGKSALDRQQQILNGNYTDFYNAPDYLATLQQGQKFMDRSAAARGGLYSSAHSADMQKYGQGLASQQLNNYWSKLAGQAGQGYNAGNALGQFGANMASQNAAQYQNAGNARASSYLAAGNADAAMWGNTMGAIGNLAGNYFAGRQQAQPTTANPQAGYTMNNMQSANWNALGYQNPTYYRG